ncbi:MAG: hypothetical protein J2P34_05610, partial [Actinobacteria bacterium]|nr:hypothetical protein [Actinomycetota bacterium]
MSPAVWIPAAAGILVAGAAVVSRWRAGQRRQGPLRRAHRWFAVTALCWAAGLVVRQAAAGTAGSFTIADLLPLAGLVAAVAGMRALAAGRPAAPAGWPAARPARLGAAGLAVRIADGYLLASALFLIGWVAIFAADYAHWGQSAGAFAAELIHPVADVAVLGWVLPLAVAAGWPAAAGCLALLAVGAGESLDVAARASGGHAGLATQVLVLAAVA